MLYLVQFRCDFTQCPGVLPFNEQRGCLNQTVFRFRDILRRIRILESVQWITGPALDPEELVSECQFIMVFGPMSWIRTQRITKNRKNFSWAQIKICIKDSYKRLRTVKKLPFPVLKFTELTLVQNNIHIRICSDKSRSRKSGFVLRSTGSGIINPRITTFYFIWHNFFAEDDGGGGSEPSLDQVG